MGMNYKLIKKGVGFGFVTGAILGGAAAGFSGALAGNRKDGAKEGVMTGALVGASALLAPRAGKFIFRRIRGRIVPIMQKYRAMAAT